MAIYRQIKSGHTDIIDNPQIRAVIRGKKVASKIGPRATATSSTRTSSTRIPRWTNRRTRRSSSSSARSRRSFSSSRTRWDSNPIRRKRHPKSPPLSWDKGRGLYSTRSVNDPKHCIYLSSAKAFDGSLLHLTFEHGYLHRCTFFCHCLGFKPWLARIKRPYAAVLTK